jgi:hypothetical protein
MALAFLVFLQPVLPPEPRDPEVLKAKTQLEDGDRPSARETLERATLRLESTGPRTRELAIAYYYGGVLEADQGRGESARDLFRKALAIEPGLPAPAKGLEAFEAARRAERAPTRRPGVWKGALVAGVLLGAAVVALAHSGGSDTAPSTKLSTQTFTGEVGSGASQLFPVIVAQTGIVTVIVEWSEPGAILGLELDDANHQPLAVSVQNTPMQATLSVVASPGSDILFLTRRDGFLGPATYTLTVSHP